MNVIQSDIAPFLYEKQHDSFLRDDINKFSVDFVDV